VGKCGPGIASSVSVILVCFNEREKEEGHVGVIFGVLCVLDDAAEINVKRPLSTPLPL
jgi:hypothetical protein